MSLAKKLIRLRFRDEVFARDHHKCVFCAATVGLDAHHITDRNELPNGGYVKENGITLCEVHHAYAEEYHIAMMEGFTPEEAEELCQPGYLPRDLYAKIGSSYELAHAAALRLAPA
jgi:hypothetical protein